MRSIDKIARAFRPAANYSTKFTMQMNTSNACTDPNVKLKRSIRYGYKQMEKRSC